MCEWINCKVGVWVEWCLVVYLMLMVAVFIIISVSKIRKNWACIRKIPRLIKRKLVRSNIIQFIVDFMRLGFLWIGLLGNIILAYCVGPIHWCIYLFIAISTVSLIFLLPFGFCEYKKQNNLFLTKPSFQQHYQRLFAFLFDWLRISAQHLLFFSIIFIAVVVLLYAVSALSFFELKSTISAIQKVNGYFGVGEYKSSFLGFFIGLFGIAIVPIAFLQAWWAEWRIRLHRAEVVVRGISGSDAVKEILSHTKEQSDLLKIENACRYVNALRRKYGKSGICFDEFLLEEGQYQELLAQPNYQKCLTRLELVRQAIGACDKNTYDHFLKNVCIHIQEIQWHLAKEEDKAIEESDSRFKAWLFPLANFRYQHTPYRSDSHLRNPDTPKFFGREKITRKFLATLRHNDAGSGSYLISGYRGAGKTSFVKKTLEDYRLGTVAPILQGSQHKSWWFRNLLNHIKRCWGQIAGAVAIAWHKERFNYYITNQNTRLNSSLLRSLILIFQEHWRVLCVTALGLVWVGCLFFIPLPVLDGDSSIVGIFESPFINSYFTLGVFLGIPVLFALLLGLPDLRHRPLASLSNLRWWRNALLRPVITIHLNLGSQALKPKEVLFDIVTLLRNELTKHSGYFRLLPICHCVFIPFFALLVTVWVGDFLRLEPWVQQKMFGFQVMQKSQADKLISKVNAERSCQSADQCFFTLKKRENGRNLTNRYIFNGNGESLAQCLWPKSENHDILGQRLEATIAQQKACTTVARRVCDMVKDKGMSLSASQALYCAGDRFLQYAFRSPSQIAEDNQGKNKASYRHNWLFYPIRWIEYYWHLLVNNVGELILREPPKPPRPMQMLLFLTFWLILSGMMYWVGRFSQRRVVKVLDNIHARIAATETREFTIRSRLFGASKKQIDTPLDIRQTENLLLQALAENQRIPFFFPRPDIIFVFDELDKINAPVTNEQSTVQSLDEKTPEEDIKQRKKDVEILLSQLKNLITTAACRFIFIGGREMHDSYLGDQGSPHHLYSSIFDGVFYVESFLTDGSDERDSDVSSMVEQYLCRMLMPPIVARYIAMRLNSKKSHKDLQPSNYQPWNLHVYNAYLRYVCGRHITESEHLQAISFMANLLYFLTYRSRGNPKKLGLLFEQFVWSVPKRSHSDQDKRYRRIGPVFPKTRFALIMYRDDIYQIDMIANLYILLHGDTSHLIRQYGDKLTFSTFSIFDYLLKFHNMSFGPRELEYMPEVIDVHRAPALPKIIELILKRLESTYLRKPQNGLFEYRYISAFHREIEYVSQRSEENLAAFNFTLDESSEIKSHYTKLLREQSALWGGLSEQDSKTSEGQHVHSVPALFSTLGDLHMLDHEYERALASYRNALSVLEKSVAQLSPKLNEKGKPYNNTYVSLTSSIRSLIIYIRVQLKIGLLSEMRGHYDNAAAIYAQTHRMVIQIASHIDLGATAIASDAEVIELLYQPRIAQSFLHAKRGHSYKGLEILSDQAIAEYLMLWDRNIRVSERTEKKIKYSQYANWLRVKQKDSRLTYQLNAPSALNAAKEFGSIFKKSFAPISYKITRLIPTHKTNDKFRATVDDILYKPQIFSLAPYLQPKLIGTFYLYRAQALQVRSQYFQAIGSLQMSLDLALVVKEKSDKLPFKLVADVMVNFGYSLSAVAYQQIHRGSRSGLGPINQAMTNIFNDYENRDGGLCWENIVEKDDDNLYEILSSFKTMLENGVEMGRNGDSEIRCKHFGGLDTVYKNIDAQINKIKNNDSEEDIISECITPNGKLDIAVHLGLLGRLAFYIAHKAYILAGEPLAAWLALWRVQYIAIYVANYWELLGIHGFSSADLYIDGDLNQSHLQQPLISKKVNRRLKSYGHEMVDSTYRVHQMKLNGAWKADIQKDNPISEHALTAATKWIAPMWVKNAQVCEGFWNFYLDNNLSHINQSVFSITDMGSYPALTRVMAEFLKGRAYLIKLQREFLLSGNEFLPGMHFYQKLTDGSDGENKANQRKFTEYWFKSFNFLTRSLSDGIAFEGGVDLLMPPLGFAYFYLWQLLQYKGWLQNPYFLILGNDQHRLRKTLSNIGEHIGTQKPFEQKVAGEFDQERSMRANYWDKLQQLASGRNFWFAQNFPESIVWGELECGLSRRISSASLDEELTVLRDIVRRFNNTIRQLNQIGLENITVFFQDSAVGDEACCNHQNQRTIFGEMKALIDQDKEFQGDKKRYLDITHCRARARQFLTQMVGRHRANKAYFDYVETRYYLQDDFADPNFQAGWACEYALLPIAEHMLQQLNAEGDQEEHD